MTKQGLLQELSKQMTKDFGKGFTVANLKTSIMCPTQFATQCVAIWGSKIKLSHILKICNCKAFTKVFCHLFR